MELIRVMAVASPRGVFHKNDDDWVIRIYDDELSQYQHNDNDLFRDGYHLPYEFSNEPLLKQQIDKLSENGNFLQKTGPYYTMSGYQRLYLSSWRDAERFNVLTMNGGDVDILEKLLIALRTVAQRESLSPNIGVFTQCWPYNLDNTFNVVILDMNMNNLNSTYEQYRNTLLPLEAVIQILKEV